MKNPNRAGCNVIETIWVLKFPQVQGSLLLARKVALDEVAYENETIGLKIENEKMKNPNRIGMNVCNRNFREFIAHCSTQERLY